MARPQSPELHRSGNTPALDPDNIASRLEAHTPPTSSGETGPVPAANQPGHRPEREQDKPDPDAFVERFRRPPTTERSDRPDATEHSRRAALERIARGGRPLASSAWRAAQRVIRRRSHA